LFYDGEHRAATWLTLAAADLLLPEVPALELTLRKLMPRALRYVTCGLRKDLLQHYAIAIDAERGEWHAFPKSGKFTWHPHASGMCWGDAAGRLPDMAVIAHTRAEKEVPGMVPLLKSLWAKLDNRRLQWMIDPDGRQLPDEVRYTERTLSSEVPAD